MWLTRILATTFLTLVLSAPAMAVRDCGADPGPPQPVLTTTCDIDAVLRDLKRLFQSVRYRSCLAIDRPIAAPEDAAARELRQGETYLADPRLKEHLEACAARK